MFRGSFNVRTIRAVTQKQIRTRLQCLLTNRCSTSFVFKQVNHYRQFGFHFHSVLIRNLMSRNFRSLMPRTIIKCSTRRNGPCCSLYAMIRPAKTSPTPGNFSISVAGAELMFILSASSFLFANACEASFETRRGSSAHEQNAVRYAARNIMRGRGILYELCEGYRVQADSRTRSRILGAQSRVCFIYANNSL